MNVRKRNFTLTTIITSLLLAALMLCAGCAGGGSSTTPAIGSSGSPAPPKAIQGQGEKPVSVPDASPREGGVPLLVHFWDGGSYDPDGEIIVWSWNFGDSSNGDPGWENYTASRGEAWHEYTSPGIKVAHLWVYDNDLNSDVAYVKIEMKQGNNANPIAVASADPAAGNAPLTVNFSAAGSYDPDGTIVMYEWDFGEGGGYEEPTLTPGTPTHVYSAEGTYTAILQVTDDDGAQSMDSVEITVGAPAGGRDEWWMFGHDPTHSGRSPFTGPTTNNLKWSEWTVDDSGFGPAFSPAVSSDGTVYVGAGTNFYAFSSEGTLKWMKSSYDYEGTYDMSAAPAIGTDGTIYVEGGPPFGSGFGGEPCFLLAIHPDDGTLMWSRPTGGSSNFSSGTTIAADGTIYLGTDALYAYRPDGTLKWSCSVGSRIGSPSTAIAADGTIYVGCQDHNLYAINPDDGTLLSGNWPFTTGGSVESSPAIGADGTIYVGSDDRSLYAVNPDGTEMWRYTTGGYIGWSSPAIGADGTVYIGSSDHNLYAINPDDGTPLSGNWPFNLGGILNISPAIDADGTIYAGSSDSNLYAINPDGTPKWIYPAGGPCSTSPAIGGDGTIYIGAGAMLHAVGPGEGI